MNTTEYDYYAFHEFVAVSSIWELISNADRNTILIKSGIPSTESPEAARTRWCFIPESVRIKVIRYLFIENSRQRDDIGAYAGKIAPSHRIPIHTDPAKRY